MTWNRQQYPPEITVWDGNLTTWDNAEPELTVWDENLDQWTKQGTSDGQ